LIDMDEVTDDVLSQEPFIQEETAHEFDALNTLLLVVILALCILSSYLIKKYKCYYIPESAATLLIGLVVGGAARLLDPSKAELDFLSFDPELFFFLLLPPIIFEAGYTLRSKQFFRNIGTIVAFAVVGTLASTFIVGYLVLAIGKLGWIDIDTEDPMEALLFGALISAVDPVATLSIMGNPELNCDPLLYSLVFGESVLNDAVAIVLFRVFYSYYGKEGGMTSSQIPAAVGEFVTVSIGSIVIGVCIGLLCSFMFKHSGIGSYPTYEIGLLFLFAYGSYAMAEAVELSGIMALFFCGIILAHYNSYNLSEVSKDTADIIFHAMAHVSETFVFLLMGMGIFTGRFSNWSPTFIVMAILFCLVARLFNTFPISFVANFTRTVKIPFTMQLVIWFAGLRGAIAFALSQNMPGAHKSQYETTTLGVVFFTTVVCGGLTEKVITRAGMKRIDSGATSEDFSVDESAAVGLLQGGASPAAALSARRQQGDGGGGGRGGIHVWWKGVDAKFMKPYFGGSSAANNNKQSINSSTTNALFADDPTSSGSSGGFN